MGPWVEAARPGLAAPYVRAFETTQGGGTRNAAWVYSEPTSGERERFAD